jgi:hypothetical protein
VCAVSTLSGQARRRGWLTSIFTLELLNALVIHACVWRGVVQVDVYDVVKGVIRGVLAVANHVPALASKISAEKEVECDPLKFIGLFEYFAAIFTFMFGPHERGHHLFMLSCFMFQGMLRDMEDNILGLTVDPHAHASLPAKGTRCVIASVRLPE